MEKKLLSPDIRLTIGDYTMADGFEIEFLSSNAPSSDWCKIDFDDRYKDLLNLNNMDEAMIEIGYDDDYCVLMSGHLNLDKNDYWKSMIIRDDMIKLENTIIKETFLNCTPQDIIKYILSLGEIDNFQLNDTIYEKKKMVSINKKNAIEAIQEINSIWNINYNFFVYNQCFYWGCFVDQEEIYTLEENQSILNLTKYNELWQLETFAIPWIHHSQEVALNHNLCTENIFVDRVSFKSDKNGFIRMYIYFKGGSDNG